MSTQFLTDPKIEALGEKHGPAGPLVIVALLGRAKIANDAGRVSCSFRTLAHEAFTDREAVAGILNEAAGNGLIEIKEMDEGEAKVRFPAFRRWQDAGRKAEEREASKPADKANVQTRPDLSADVHTDRQTEKTDKQTKKKADPDSLPKDFPPGLVAAVDSTRPILQGTASSKGAKPVDRLPLAKVIAQFPDHDHIAVANACDLWACHGKGERENHRDIVALYRNFLKREEPMALAPAQGKSVADRMAEALPDIDRGQLERSIYRLQRSGVEVTPEAIKEAA